MLDSLIEFFIGSSPACVPFLLIKTYTYTAYTEADYQGVTDQVPYTGGGTDTYTGKSFNNYTGTITFFPIF